MGFKTIKRWVGHGQLHYTEQKTISHILINYCSLNMQVDPFPMEFKSFLLLPTTEVGKGFIKLFFQLLFLKEVDM